MPNIWDECAKIHKGCGGVCRWIEAIDHPGVGYTGDCTACDDTNLPTEAMIPIEGVPNQQLLRVAPCSTLAQLEWDEQSNWETNQERLRITVDGIVRHSSTHARNRLTTDGGHNENPTTSKKTESSRVGPVILSRSIPRGQLVEHGVVFSFRTSDRTTGDTHYRHTRNSTGKGKVRITKESDRIEPTVTQLSRYYRLSGFESPEAWKKAIKEVHGDVDSGFVYRIETRTPEE